MTREQLTNVLETMTGQLSTARPQQAEQLEKARTRIARSLLSSEDDATDNGLEQIFSNSDLYARDRIDTTHLKHIGTIAEKALNNRPRPRPRDDDDEEEQFFIRSTPVLNATLAGSMPDWAVGARPAESLGPFLNHEGRDIWIDFYRIQKLVTLYIGNMPAILFRASFPWSLIPRQQEVTTDYRVVAGSCWINAKLFIPTAPANQFVGMEVSSGSIRLSNAPVIQNNHLTLTTAATITASLKLVQATDEHQGNTSMYGSDARNATFELPASVDFSIQNSQLRFSNIPDASCVLLGQALSFNFSPNTPITFSIQSNRLLIPWKADSQSFAVSASSSPWATHSDTAEIISSAWTLPVAVLNITSPVVVKGNGGIWLNLSAGMLSEWSGLENEEARLQKPAVIAQPGELDIIDSSAELLGASQQFDLWQDQKQPAPCTADILYLNKSTYLFMSRSAGTELIGASADVTIHADRPVKVNGQSFPIHTRSCSVMLAANDLKRNVFLFEDVIDEGGSVNPATGAIVAPKIRKESIALENALFTVSPVAGFILFGEADSSWKKITRANLFLTFRLYSYLPTLPDPYVANLGRWRAIFERLQHSDRINTGLILIGAVSYVQLENGSDQVAVNFHFGGANVPNFFELPEQPETPAATPVTPRQPTTIIKPFGRFQNSKRFTVRDLIGRATTIRPQQPTDSQPSLDPSVTEALAGADQPVSHIAMASRINLEERWDKAFGIADHFSLLDVSSNANQLGVSFGTNMTLIKTGDVRGGGDDQPARVAASTGATFPFIVEGLQVKLPSRNVRAFTLPLVAWEPEINLTKPDRTDEEDPNSAKLPMDPVEGLMYYANDGGPSRFWNNNTTPVSLAPIPIINELIDDYKQRPGNYTIAAISLPFGMRGLAFISKGLGQTILPEIKNIRPNFRRDPDGSHRLTGGIQLRLLAGNYGKKSGPVADHDSPLFPGYTMQFNNVLNWIGQPSGASNLGDRVTTIFNSEFIFAPLNNSTDIGLSRGVPVSRMDITGYGANMFSNWLSPTAAIAQTSQARFDVLMGRTGHEVIQVKSILYPWGIRVVRTITVFRTGSGYVFRTDSGWKAESDGRFDFSYKYDEITNPNDPSGNFTYAPKEVKVPYEYHPGVIRGLYNIKNIKDAPSVREFRTTNTINPGEIYLYGVLGKELKRTGSVLHEDILCGAVYFDADIEIENIVQGSVEGAKEVDLGGKKTKYGRVASKKILGYVQLSPQGKPLTPLQLKQLLQEQNGSIGAEVDCEVNISNSNQQMHVNKIDVSASVAKTGNNPVFVLAARGQVYLPKDGSWSMVQHNSGSGEVTPLPMDVTVPLIRRGLWVKEDVIDKAKVKSELARIAHPMELLREPAADTLNFGFLQITGTQKALFLTPAYGIDVQKLLSKTPPIFADAYRLMTGNGIFPNIGNAIDNFGKAMPMDKVMEGPNAVKAFADSAWDDGSTKALELLDVLAEKTGDAVKKQGMKLLQKADEALDKALEFAIPQLSEPIYLVKTDALKIYIEYKATPKGGSNKPGKLDFSIDSFTNKIDEQWRSRMNNLAMVVDLSEMTRIMTIKGNFDSKKGKESNYEGGDDIASELPTPEIEFSDALKPVIDILEVLSKLSTGDYAGAMKKGLKIAMSNSGEIWEYKFEATKEIPLVRFPPTDELYNSAQTPLKLEASMALGVYFNAALKVTTEPGQLLPTAGAFVKFHGGLSVMCFSVGVGTIYAVGAVDVKLAADTKVGPSVALKFGFGVQLVVSLPVVGSVSVTYMVGVEMYADKTKVIVAALMLFRGQASLIGGLVCVTITIEAKGIIERQIGSDETKCSAQVTFAIDISIFLVIDISFSKTWGETRQIA